MRSESKVRDGPGIVLAVGFIALGAWVILETGNLSPLGSVFPRTIGIALILFSLVSLVASLRSVPAGDEQAERKAPESTPRRLGLVAVMGAWGLLIPVVGFFVTSLLAFGALLVISEYEHWTARRAALYAVTMVVIVAAFYYLMQEILLIPVPKGLLF